jgi:hypothetical protein
LGGRVTSSAISLSAAKPLISSSNSASDEFSKSPRRAIVSSVIVVVSWSQVEGLDNPNPTKDHCGGRPGRSAWGFATRPGLRRSYTTTRDTTGKPAAGPAAASALTLKAWGGILLRAAHIHPNPP